MKCGGRCSDFRGVRRAWDEWCFGFAGEPFQIECRKYMETENGNYNSLLDRRLLLSHLRLYTSAMGSGVGRINKGKTSKRARRRRQDARAIDQIHDDLSDTRKADKLRNAQPIDMDLPGLGQFYCVECARYFISSIVLSQHTKTKKHKNRLKELKEKPYSQAEAEAAAGMAPTDNGPSFLSIKMAD